MIQLDLIQTSCSAINSIYIYRNFIQDESQFNLMLNEMKKITEIDEMNRSTNVIANMTNYTKLLENKNFNYMHQKIIEILNITHRLRTPHWKNSYNYHIHNSWGMKHQKGDFTKNHIHYDCKFSAAFYFKVPKNIFMTFDDYEESICLEDNMLLLFPSLTKHSVGKQTEDGERLSMACNINITTLHE